MEIKATLSKPYSEEDREGFIVEYNHNKGYLIKETENYNLTNEQWFLNKLDEINKLSVKY